MLLDCVALRLDLTDTFPRNRNLLPGLLAGVAGLGPEPGSSAL
jgi:hypothetical protein